MKLPVIAAACLPCALALAGCVNEEGIKAVAKAPPYEAFESRKSYGAVVECVGQIRLWGLSGTLHAPIEGGYRWRYEATGSDVMMVDVRDTKPVRVEWRQKGPFLGAAKRYREEVKACAQPG